MAIGETVLVRSFPSDPVLRRVFKDTEDGPLICLEQAYKLWEGRGIQPLTVQSPGAVVFKYDESLYARLREAAYVKADTELLESLWSQAEAYRSDQRKDQRQGK